MRHSLSGLLAFALGSLVACGGAEQTFSPPVPPAPVIPPFSGPSMPAQAAPSSPAATQDTAVRLG